MRLLVISIKSIKQNATLGLTEFSNIMVYKLTLIKNL